MVDVPMLLDRHTDGRLGWVGRVALLGAAGFAIATAFAVVATSVGWFSVSTSSLTFSLGVPAAVGGFVASGVCWWVAVERPGAPGARHGAVAGGASGLLAHPVMWLAAGLASVGLQAASVVGGSAEGAVLTAADVVDLLTSVALFTVISLVVLGWLTVAVGAGLGAVLGGRRAEAPSGS